MSAAYELVLRYGAPSLKGPAALGRGDALTSLARGWLSEVAFIRSSLDTESGRDVLSKLVGYAESSPLLLPELNSVVSTVVTTDSTCGKGS